MDIRDPRSLSSAARESLRHAAYDPKRLILLHAGVSAAFLLAATVLNFWLQSGIADTGGLGGIPLRSVLSTAVVMLQLLTSVALPFWTAGYTAAMLRLSRREEAGPRTLLLGFTRWGAVLRLQLVQGIVYSVIALLCSYVSSAIFSVTPLAEPMMEIMLPYTSDPNAVLDEAAVAAIMEASRPVWLIFVPVFLLAAAPVFYRLRMAELVLMDDPNAGAFAAVFRSLLLTRYNCRHLLRIDLSYWWFYGAELLLAAVAYGDWLLDTLGIQTSMSGDVLGLLFYLAYTAGQLVLYYFAKNRVYLTYAFAYHALQDPSEPEPQAAPRNLPWNY